MDVVANILVFFTISIIQEAETNALHHPGGREVIATDGQFPFQALIRVKYGDPYSTCSGIILSPDYILTAAGCIKHSTKSIDDLEVLAGGTSANTKSSSSHVQKSSAKNLLVHPMWYTTNGKLADIALMMVYPKFKETLFVKWAGIDHRLKSSRVLISGWGRADQLIYFEGQVYKENTCNRALNNEILLSTICISSTRSGKLLSTKIYAGAGVGNGNSIYGIVSSTENGVATVITYYKSWIESVIYRSLDEETMETDRDLEEAIPPTQYAIHAHSSIHSSPGYFKSSIPSFDDETSEEVRETADIEDDDETEIISPYTPTLTTSFKEEILEGSSEIEETEISEPSMQNIMSNNSVTYRTAPLKPSIPILVSSFNEEISEEPDEIDENYQRAILNPERLHFDTSTSVPYKPSTGPSPLDERTLEESSELDETEGNEWSALYSIFQSSTVSRTIPSRLSTIPINTSFEEETLTESTEIDGAEENDEVEEIAQYNSFIHPQKTTELLRSTTQLNEDKSESGETNDMDGSGGTESIHYNTETGNSIGPGTFSKRTKNNGIKDTEQYNGADMSDEVYKVKKPEKFQPSGIYVIRRRQEPKSSIVSHETTGYLLSTDKYDVNKPPPVSRTSFNSIFVPNENNTNNTNDFHSEPASSASVKFLPPSFAIILSYLAGILVTRNLP